MSAEREAVARAIRAIRMFRPSSEELADVAIAALDAHRAGQAGRHGFLCGKCGFVKYSSPPRQQCPNGCGDIFYHDDCGKRVEVKHD